MGNYKEGSIMMQSRAAGDEVKANTKLTITVAINTKNSQEGIEE